MPAFQRLDAPILGVFGLREGGFQEQAAYCHPNIRNSLDICPLERESCPVGLQHSSRAFGVFVDTDPVSGPALCKPRNLQVSNTEKEGKIKFFLPIFMPLSITNFPRKGSINTTLANLFS